MIYLLLGTAVSAIVGFVGLFLYMQVDSYRSLVKEEPKSNFQIEDAELVGSKANDPSINEDLKAAVEMLSKKIATSVASSITSQISTKVKP